MRTSVLVLTGLIMTLLVFPVSAQSTSDSDAEIIKRLNHEALWSLLVERDPSILDQLALDQLIVVAPGGVVESKEQAIAGAGSLDVRSIELSDEQVVFHGDTAVLVGKLEADGTMKPLGRLPTMKYMAVFVRADGNWRLLARSLTPCAPLAIEHGVC